MGYEEEVKLANHQRAIIEDYLRSEKAKSAVETAISWTTVPDWSKYHDELEDQWIWAADRTQAWVQIMVYIGSAPASRAFYRQVGERYEVTDLGEGARSLRLRTGKPLAGWENWFNGVVDSTAGVILLRFVESADLPDAVCKVLHASYRVAHRPEE